MNCNLYFLITFGLSTLIPLPAGAVVVLNHWQDDTGQFEVFVVQEGWHTGIIFHTDDVHADEWAEIKHYDHRKFVDVGWGDEKFYQVSGYPLWLAARAIFWPTRSVLQIYAYSIPITSAYADNSTILRIPVNYTQLSDLSCFIAESYERDKNGDPVPSTIYGKTDYYFLATRKYHLFRTCNTWVALAFKAAGFDVNSFGVIYAGQLFRELSNIEGVGAPD